MEHKLVQGGEQYLPFARSRVKALRATGLQYASQRFDMGDALVEVKIALAHEYITISGGVKILSGAVKGGVIAESGTGADAVKLLQSYRPTQQAWELALNKPVQGYDSFYGEPQLAIEADASLGVGSQYQAVCPSMYSGAMAQIAQVILGYSKKSKVKLTYDYRWVRCHGVVRAADGRWWIVEVSQANGVLVMLLPIKPASASSKQDVIKETVKKFKGIPSGRAFPIGEKLADAIQSRKVLRLLTPADMVDFYEGMGYVESLGWSFNDDGSQAHNTCYKFVGDEEVHSFHHRIDFAIGGPDQSGDIQAQATLARVSTGQLTTYGEGSKIPFSFEAANLPGRNIPIAEGDHYGVTPLFVYHQNNSLIVVEVVAQAVGANPTYIFPTPADEFNHARLTGDFNTYENQWTPSRYVRSSVFDPGPTVPGLKRKWEIVAPRTVYNSYELGYSYFAIYKVTSTYLSGQEMMVKPTRSRDACTRVNFTAYDTQTVRHIGREGIYTKASYNAEYGEQIPESYDVVSTNFTPTQFHPDDFTDYVEVRPGTSYLAFPWGDGPPSTTVDISYRDGLAKFVSTPSKPFGDTTGLPYYQSKLQWSAFGSEPQIVFATSMRVGCQGSLVEPHDEEEDRETVYSFVGYM